MKYNFKTNTIKSLSDLYTPVELYLKLRDQFSNSFLLESSDYKSKENSFSYIALDPIASFIVDKSKTEIVYPDYRKDIFDTSEIDVANKLYQFTNTFDIEDNDLGFVTKALFGYTSYDAIPLFKKITFKNQDFDFPLMQYHLFRYLVVFNHFNNELYLLEFLMDGEKSNMENLKALVMSRAVSSFSFTSSGEETTNFTDADFLERIKKGVVHCHLGDVFQVVFSRKFKQEFEGDEFNVYRALRSINPSPYLFYFDYGNFKIFGSSPEAQLIIAHKQAVINPIAGTFKRTGNTDEDALLAKALQQDPKENAEHVMLVDLARNDLSINSKHVTVEKLKQVEFYSHVIHLVSKVSATLPDNYNPIEILGNTYPAGTLSGAPKHRAMQLIDENENESRGFYGGAVGILGLDGSFNHAIFIRSFLSTGQQLTYQAGCGIVAKSNPKSELEEVNHKLSALRKAIELAKII